MGLDLVTTTSGGENTGQDQGNGGYSPEDLYMNGQDLSSTTSNPFTDDLFSGPTTIHEIADELGISYEIETGSRTNSG